MQNDLLPEIEAGICFSLKGLDVIWKFSIKLFHFFLVKKYIGHIVLLFF